MKNDSKRFREPDDDWDDGEYPDDDDSDDQATETIRCSNCGAEIYEDAVQCPHCGSYVTADTNPWSGRSFVWILLGLLGSVAVIGMLAGLFRG